MRHRKEKGDDPEKDLESADPNKQTRISFADGWNPDQDDGEYANLVRYISTYRDRRFSRAGSVSQASGGEEDESKPKIPWYKPWMKLTHQKADPGDAWEVPFDWLSTEIRTGLTSAEVTQRRKKAGFNELTTEKENMFLKFLGYFQGPILYGKFAFRLPEGHRIVVNAPG